MKKYRIAFFLLLFSLTLHAQDGKMSVRNFKLLENDTKAKLISKKDKSNGKPCALIIVETNWEGLTFDFGVMTNEDEDAVVPPNREHPSEYWVWAMEGVTHISIQGTGLKKLNYQFRIPIEGNNTYSMELNMPAPVNQPEIIPKQYLCVQVEPKDKDAKLTVDGDDWPLKDGYAQKTVKQGIHRVIIEAEGYHLHDENVTVGDQRKEVLVHLKPSYGFLIIKGDSTLLANSSIWIDNTIKGTDAIRAPKQLKSKMYKLQIQHPLYKKINEDFYIADLDTTTFTAEFVKNFAHVTFVVDADAEIYIDGELEGLRSCSDDLVYGYHDVECRMKNHKNTYKQVSVSYYMPNDIIVLEVPKPIKSTLDVVTTPPKATVFLDDIEIGDTPHRDLYQIGEHQLRLVKEGYTTLTKTITIKEGVENEVNETLEEGKKYSIISEHEGDPVMVDGEYAGKTPLDVNLGIGSHVIKVMRDGVVDEKTVEVTDKSGKQIITFDLSRVVTLITKYSGDSILVDGAFVGISPVQADLTYGTHHVYAKHGKKQVNEDIEVLRERGHDSFRLKMRGASNDGYIRKGTCFTTLDFASDFKWANSYGLTFGYVKRLGFFINAMSSFDFNAYNYNYIAGNSGLINGVYPNYTGEYCVTRLSAVGGMMFHVAGPLCFKVGAGYGVRMKSWYLSDGKLVNIPSDSFVGVDATAGLQFVFRHFTFSLDAISTNLKTTEVKLGIGAAW